MNAIAALAGMILSLSFRFIPGLKGWFERLSSEGKSGVMASYDYPRWDRYCPLAM